MILIVSGISYALWLYVFTQKEENVVKSDCFQITWKEDSNSNINLYNMYPMNEFEGLRLKPYTFEIENICNSNSNYQVNLEVLENSTMPDNIMKAKLNESQSIYQIGRAHV